MHKTSTLADFRYCVRRPTPPSKAWTPDCLEICRSRGFFIAWEPYWTPRSWTAYLRTDSVLSQDSTADPESASTWIPSPQSYLWVHKQHQYHSNTWKSRNQSEPSRNFNPSSRIRGWRRKHHTSRDVRTSHGWKSQHLWGTTVSIYHHGLRTVFRRGWPTPAGLDPLARSTNSTRRNTNPRFSWILTNTSATRRRLDQISK